MQVNELFKKLVESELLTEETRTELVKEVEVALNEAVEAAKVEATAAVRAELTEQFVADKEALIEALDSKATEFLTKHLAEFADDVERFRDLEVEKEEQVVQAKKEMAETVKADMATLVTRLDEFLEMRLTAEFQELKEDIEQVKKLNFGKKIFEAVQSEYADKYVNSDETALALAKANEEIKNTQKVLEGVTTELAAAKRVQKLSQVLESLQGRPREVMAAILNNVPTDKLEEQYKVFIGRVLHESVVSKVEESTDSEKENGDEPSVLAEGEDHSAQEKEVTTKVVTGNSPVVEEVTPLVDETKQKLSESEVERLRRLGGIQ